jgi:hypothetical protein
MATPFTRLLESARSHARGLTLEVPDDWEQGRSVFGGMQAALALRAMRALVPSAPLRALQTTFIAPVAGVLDVQVSVLREGKNATHVEARVRAHEPGRAGVHEAATAALVIGVFGTPRESSARVTPVQPPLEVPSPVPLIHVPGITPNFIQHFDGRLLRGALPFAGVNATEASYQASLRDAAAVGEAHLVALADYVPPLALSHLRRPAPGSTVTWLLELLGEGTELPPSSEVRIDVHLVAAQHGYTSQAVTLWGPAGEALALSHQSMLVFG